jgi:hypothetical protein
MTSGQITCDLRRLRVHGLIERIPRTHRYQVTDIGLRHALFLTRLHAASCAQGSASSPASPRPSPRNCAPPTAPTATRSTNLPAGRD